jgi:hypothetical protein
MQHANALITVRFAGPSHTKGSRWIVRASTVHDDVLVRRTISRDHGVSLTADADAAAAAALTALADAVAVRRQKSVADYLVHTAGTFVARHAGPTEYLYMSHVATTFQPRT